MRLLNISIIALACSTLPAAAQSANVTFAGLVLNTCTLIATPGLLALSADGLKLSSVIAGGVAAEVAIVSLGVNTITVNAPTLTDSPAAYNPTGQVLRVGYQGLTLLSSVVQALTGVTTNFGIPVLPLTVLEIDNELENASGFAQGAYETTTVVTCS